MTIQINLWWFVIYALIGLGFAVAFMTVRMVSDLWRVRHHPMTRDAWPWSRILKTSHRHAMHTFEWQFILGWPVVLLWPVSSFLERRREAQVAS